MIELYFHSAVQFCENNTGRRYSWEVIEYLGTHFNRKTYSANKYGSIESEDVTPGDGIPIVTTEVMRGLIIAVLGLPARDVYVRIEEEAIKAIRAERRLSPAWDADCWIEQGAVRPRLEAIEEVESNKVLRAAIRRCHREGVDSTVRHWAMWIREKRVRARMVAHNKLKPHMRWFGMADRMTKRRR